MKLDKPGEKVNESIKEDVLKDNPEIKYFEFSALIKNNTKDFHSAIYNIIKENEKFLFLKNMCLIKNLYNTYKIQSHNRRVMEYKSYYDLL